MGSSAPLECSWEGGQVDARASPNHLGDFVEPLVERALLLRALQGYEPHAVHRLWAAGTGEHDGHLADHAQYDRGGHLLCHVHRARHCAHPVPGLLTPPVPGEGQRREAMPWL